MVPNMVSKAGFWRGPHLLNLFMSVIYLLSTCEYGVTLKGGCLSMTYIFVPNIGVINNNKHTHKKYAEKLLHKYIMYYFVYLFRVYHYSLNFP